MPIDLQNDALTNIEKDEVKSFFEKLIIKYQGDFLPEDHVKKL